MEKILISACLAGHPVRYDGNAKTCSHAFLTRWRQTGRLVLFCPEIAGGLTTPRPPAEIGEGKTGTDVLCGTARVITQDGADLTDAYLAGARGALRFARAHGCRYALLNERSPSCGCGVIYDGRFSGILHPGNGVTTALLRRHGLQVFSQQDICLLARRLSRRNAITG